MEYLATVTFDIQAGESADYVKVYAGLAELGLNNYFNKSPENALPTTTVTGEFNNDSSAALRTKLSQHIEAIYKRHNLHGKIFISIGTDWSMCCKPI